MTFGIQQILMLLVVSWDILVLPDQPAIAQVLVQGKIVLCRGAEREHWNTVH